MKNGIQICFLLLLLSACVSTKNNIKTIDNNAPIPVLTLNNTFELKEKTLDKKYGFHEDYPINVYYLTTENDTLNAIRFLNELTGPQGELVSYKKLESCCPFNTKQSKIGAGFLEVYEVYWHSNAVKKMYFNIYERGQLYIPYGFSSKTVQSK